MYEKLLRGPIAALLTAWKRVPRRGIAGGTPALQLAAASPKWRQLNTQVQGFCLTPHTSSPTPQAPSLKPQASSLKPFSPGFTIMEVMVVVAIFGLLMAASTLTLRNITRSELRSAARRTASAMRFAFDRATMTGMYIRLAFNLDKGEIWVETSTDRVSLRSGGDRQAQSGSEDASEKADKPTQPKATTKPLLPLLGANKSEPGSVGGEPGEGPQGIDAKALTEEWEADLAPAERPQPHFQPMKGLLSKKIKLAQGISLSAVMTPRMKEPLEKGMAYVYFFPQGHSEPAIIHFVDRASEHYSVVLHPLTGQAKVFSCLYRIPSDFGVSDDKLSRSAPDPCSSKSGI